MLRAITGFLQQHGFHMLIGGFVILAVSTLLYTVAITTHRLTPTIKIISFSGAFTGFIIYAIGRIIVYLERKTMKPNANKSDNKGPV